MSAATSRVRARLTAAAAVVLLAATCLPFVRPGKAAAVSGDTITISSPTVNEGNTPGQTTDFVFNVTLTPGGPVYGGETVNWTTQDGTAKGGTSCTSGVDYVKAQSSNTDPNNLPLFFSPADTVLTKQITVKVCQDTQNEDNETFNVVLTPSDTSTTPNNTNVGTGTIQNDDAGLAPKISVNSPSVTEGDNSGTVTPMTFHVALSSAATGPITVHYAFIGVTATQPDDYIAPDPGDLTFAGGDTSMDLTVEVVGDTLDEVNEQVRLDLSQPNNVEIPNNMAQTYGTIIDDDGSPAVSLDPAGPQVSEAAGPANFIVHVSPVSGRSITVNYTTAGSGAHPATPNVDFNGAAGSITIPAGTETAAIPIAIVQDTAYEGDETFSLTIALSTTDPNGPGGTLDSGSATAVGTITDDDAPPTLAVADVNAPESAGTMQFTVTLTGASSVPATVDYATADGTAAAGSDYTAKSGTLTFPAGTTSQTISVPITSDPFYEDDETFAVALSNATNASVTTGTATGTIKNDDAAPDFTIHDTPMAEGDSASAPAGITVELTAVSGKDTKIDYTTGKAGDTATAGSDYVASTGTLTIPKGQQTGTISVNVFGDTVYEADETFTVNGTGEAGNTLNTTAHTGTVTITNDDAPPSVSIGDPQPITEGNTGTKNLDFTVTLSDAAGTPVSVHAATADGTAVAGTDYTATTATVTFAPGVTTQTFSVPIKGNATPQTDRTFVVNLTSPSPANMTIADNQATGTILDDDGPVPVATVANASATEGSALAYTVTLSSASTATLTVDYATSDGTAKSTSDYTATSGTLTFAPGETTKTVSVPTTQDTLDENDETVLLTLSNGAPANEISVSPGPATGTIVDDDASPTVGVTPTSAVAESAGSVTYTIALSAVSGRDVTVNYATADGTATAPADYGSVAGSVVIPAGTLSKTVTVNIVDDTLDEADETFALNLSAPAGATLSPTAGSATTTITDNDAAPTISIADNSFPEGSSGPHDVTITVTLSAASGQTVSAHWATADGTATSPADYAAASGMVTFAPGETSKTITISIVGDTAAEPDEGFTVALSALSNVTAGHTTGAETIVDDDDPAISVSSPSVNESAGTMTFNVSLSAPPTSGVTVDYAISDGTANAPSDYTASDPLSGTLTFAPGEALKTVTVNIVDDTVNEVNETLSLTLSNAAGGHILTGQGTGTIIDNDPVPALSIATPGPIAEGNSGITRLGFTVTLSAPSGRAVSVNYATSNGTAVAPSDYTAASGTLLFGKGETTKTFFVTIIGDTFNEKDESFNVTLSNASGATLPATPKVSATIANDDPLPTVSIANTTFEEPAVGTANMLFTVSVSPASGQPVTVRYKSADGTATVAGRDYQPVSGSLTIPAGATSAAIAVPVNADSVTEDDETMTLAISVPQNATLGSAVGTGTIVDALVEGYYLTAADGGIFNYGDAPFYGSIGGHALNQPVVGMGYAPDRTAYWQVAADGGVFSYPVAANRFYGSTGGKPLNKPVVGMAVTPTGHGYWLVASDGGIFNYGDAGFFGSTGGKPLNAPIVGMASTPTGRGYWLVASDGGMFAYGDAVFHGSTGGKAINSPIVGMAPTPDGLGYWLVAKDGGVFNYGDAGFFDSLGGQGVNDVIGLAASSTGQGYVIATASGDVHEFGDDDFLGSPTDSGTKLFQPIVAIAGF